MTRLARYQLYACPSCDTVYKHPLWGSISAHVPRSVNQTLDRVCTKCKFQAPLAEWSELGTVERFTADEQARRTAALLYNLSAGSKPDPETKPFFQRIRDFWLGAPKSVNPAGQYPEIKIADSVE